MSERTVIKNAVGGKFVSAEYATANPDTTYVHTIPDPDRLDVATNAIVALTDSRPSWTLTAVPGIEVHGTDVREMVEAALRQIQAKLEVTG